MKILARPAAEGTNGFLIKKFNFTHVSSFNKFIKNKINGLNITANSSLESNDLDTIVQNLDNAFRGAIHKFVLTDKLQTNKILLSQQTLSIKRKHKQLKRRLFNNTHANYTTLIRLRGEIKQIFQMLINSIQFDIRNFYNNALANTRSNRDIHRTIKFHTAYKKNARISDVLFSSENKDESVIGSKNIANAFADHFSRNHNLSTHLHSITDDEVNVVVDTINNNNIRIVFNDVISPKIINKSRWRS